jgi:thymidine kinase
MRSIVNELDIPVLCFGLRTDFLTKLFEGSRRLFEVADTISEIKTICSCGRKATVSARIKDGKIVTKGSKVLLGGDDKYLAMCHKCYEERIKTEA